MMRATTLRSVRSKTSPGAARLHAVAAWRALFASCALALLMLPGIACAQEPTVAATPRSGDAWVDGVLGDISRYAARYPDAFADELVRYDSAPRALVDALLADSRWTPGDIYFACALGQVAGQPCRAVAQRWQHDHALGWVGIAQGFGVAPDSAAYHRLKRGIVLSYARWARPLEVDASLHAEFPRLPLAPSTDTAPTGKRTPASKGAGNKVPPPKPARRGKDAATGSATP